MLCIGKLRRPSEGLLVVRSCLLINHNCQVICSSASSYDLCKSFHSCWILGRKVSSFLWDYYSKISICNRWILQTKRTGQCYLTNRHLWSYKVWNMAEHDPGSFWSSLSLYSTYEAFAITWLRYFFQNQ